MFDIKTYILVKNENNKYALSQYANDIKLNYVIIKDLNEIDQSETYALFYEDFIINDEFIGYETIKEFMNQQEFDYIVLGGDPEVFFNTSKKVAKNITKINQFHHVTAYIKHKNCKEKLDKAKNVFSVHPSIVQSTKKLKHEQMYIQLKNAYAHHIGIPFFHVTLLIIVLLFILKMFLQDYDKQLASNIILKSL